MKLAPKLEKALNRQLGVEFEAERSYLSMAAYFERESWDGFAAWMSKQSAEEREHAMKFYHYIIDRGGKVEVPAASAPKADFQGPLDVYEASLKQEQEVSKKILDLYKMAHDEGDYATVSFLKWFVDEQVEEEKTVSEMVDKLKRAGNNPDSLLMIDRYAGETRGGAQEG